MPTDVRDQVRGLAAAFDEFVDDIDIGELHSPVDVTGRHESTSRAANPAGVGKQRERRGFGIAAASVILVAGLVATLAWVGRRESDPASSTQSSVTDAPAAAVDLGEFVWPAPPRDFATLEALVAAFSTEVLEWDTYEIAGAVDDQQQPQSFTLTNSDLDVSVPAIAFPSTGGWGFAQLGNGMNATATDNGAVRLTFPTSPDVASTTLTARLADGTAVSLDAGTSGLAELPDTDLSNLITALAIGVDADDHAVLIAGGQFNVEGPTPPTVPASAPPIELPADAQPRRNDPLDYASTSSPLPLWPDANASDPPATTTGYGMDLCDSGYGTKLMRVDATTGPSHAYSGTLCVFINLATPRPDAVTTCATATDRFIYANCQRRTDDPEVDATDATVETIASDDQQAAMAAFPTATSWDQPELFDVQITGATDDTTQRGFSDDDITVTLGPVLDGNDDIVDTPGACFTIDLREATADGCVGHSLLATGLAYGAFQDGDGPIQIIGIVPDEITSVEIDGTTLTPTNNVWHHTTTSNVAPQIIVRSADGRTATTR